MSGLYACGVSAAIHTMLAQKGIECRHCKALDEAPEIDWADTDAHHEYTAYGSFGEPPHVEVF